MQGVLGKHWMSIFGISLDNGFSIGMIPVGWVFLVTDDSLNPVRHTAHCVLHSMIRTTSISHLVPIP